MGKMSSIAFSTIAGMPPTSCLFGLVSITSAKLSIFIRGLAY